MSLSDRPLPEILNRPLWQFYATGIACLALSGWLWWGRFYTAPTHVFSSMLANSLSTRSFVTEVDQHSDQDRIKQLVHTDMRAGQSRSYLQLVQGGTEVKKEVLGTRSADFTRFLAIASDQKRADGRPVDTSSVLDVWSKSDDSAQNPTTASGHQLYAQATLGIGLPIGSVPVPVGELPDRERQALLERMRSERVYQPNYETVKKERKNGRLLYTYDVKIQTILYVRLMQEFAKQLGLHELDQVDANTYSGMSQLTVKLTIDALSHRLVGVDSGQGYMQTYTGYDVPLQVSEPSNPISSAELQRRLDELQKQ